MIKLLSYVLIATSLSVFSNVATIGKVKISQDEFNQRYQQNIGLVPGPNKPSKQEVLNNIVNFELAVLEAKRTKMQLSKDIQDQVDILLYQKLIREKIQPKIDSLKVSEREIQSFYKTSPLLKTRHVVILTKPGASDSEIQKAEKKAMSILLKAKKGNVVFADLAREYSEGPSAKIGGEVDWGARHKLMPEYYDAAVELKKVGDISPALVQTSYGFHIIKLEGIKPYSKADKGYKDFMIKTIKDIKGKDIYDAYFEGLKKRFPVKTSIK